MTWLRTLEFCNFFCANNANFNTDWIFFFAVLVRPDRHLMNRTLTYASLHARDALRSNVRLQICWSCSVTQNHSQRIQHRIVQPLQYSARYLSTKQTRKERYTSKKARTVFPPLEGECPEEVPRSRDWVRAQEKEKERNLRVATEQTRLRAIASIPKKSATEKEKRKRTLVSERKLPTPEQAGISSSSSSILKSNLIF